MSSHNPINAVLDGNERNMRSVEAETETLAQRVNQPGGVESLQRGWISSKTDFYDSDSVLRQGISQACRVCFSLID